VPDSDSGVFSGQGTGNTPGSLAVADNSRCGVKVALSDALCPAYRRWDSG